MNKGGRLLYSCLNMRKQLTRFMGSTNITQGEYLVLRYMTNSKQDFESEKHSIRAAFLSSTLDMSRPAVSRILNSLENKELIMRSIDKTDRRGISIELTEKGKEELNKANVEILGKAEYIAAKLGDEETEQLITLLDKLAEIYKGMYDEKGCDEDE